ncbi:MarR family transcriptional regulator [Actinomadura barringtoniae]|uniref:MarR family transcriptional regulator n=1 Tax=Actinomadura barringtoniae TaxID=1427535 RepID=A0A939PKI8_9ACTN|nr:MarR family transcriptional regulator [Actinomadura barringtoniae]MBO2450256.1 MarR family transcriptional regulator [Actinomadura barringtoniae]
MTSVTSRRRIRTGLRELGLQLALLNRKVSTRVALKDVDLDCLDIVATHGPLGPSALAKRAGLHPATMTGILDRLEKGGWIARERDPQDRRAVQIKALNDRNRELYGHFAGMNASVEQICVTYDDEQLKVIAGFLEKVAEAGQTATQELAGD